MESLEMFSRFYQKLYKKLINEQNNFQIFKLLIHHSNYKS